MRKGSFVAATTLAVGLLAGCSANVSASSDGAEADAASTSGPAATALVSIDSISTVASDRKVSAVARFVHARDGVIDDDALRMVHASLSLPDIGTCAVPDVEPGSARAVSLLDLGSVTLESEGVQTALAPRELPDVADLVDGVVYTSRALESESLPAGSRYTVHASGNEIVPAFSIRATAPAELRGLRLGTFDADSAGAATGAATEASELLVDPSASLEVSWEASDASSERARDEVYVDVTAGSGDGSTDGAALRCAFADSGHAELPATAWDALAGASAGVLTLHRLHRELLHPSGLGAGEVRFDFARQVTFRVR